jgi:hypothetical protein
VQSIIVLIFTPPGAPHVEDKAICTLYIQSVGL